MIGVRYYGFILFFDPSGERSSWIGSSISTTPDRIKGDVRFQPENLTFQLTGWNHVYLVSYVQKTRPNSSQVTADDIRLVGAFPKKQYKGTLSVDGLGVVTFRDAQTGATHVLNGSPAGSVDGGSATVHAALSAAGQAPDLPVYSDGQRVPVRELSLPVTFPFSVSDLEAVIRKQDNGDLLAEMTLPAARFFSGEAGSGERVGVINFYMPKGEFALIRSCYQNHLFGTDDQSAESHLMVPSEADTQAVGAVKTAGNLYFVSYRDTGERRQHPRNAGETLPVAEAVRFLFAVPSRPVCRVETGEREIRVLLALKMAERQKTEVLEHILSGPTPGQTLESYLNTVASSCLKNGQMEIGLETVEKYRDRIDEDTYYSVRYRLLLRLCREKNDGKIIRDTIDCIDRILTFTTKPKFQLTLLIDKGNKLASIGEQEAAADTFREWMRRYRVFVASHPEETEGLKVSLQLVQNRLQSTEENGADADFLDGDMLTQDADELFMDSFVTETLEDEKYSCAAIFGTEYARYDDPQTLTEEDAVSIREFLDAQPPAVEQVKPEKLWALARLCHRLEEASVHVSEEDALSSLRDEFIREALYREAEKQLIAAEKAPDGGSPFRNTALLFSQSALSYYVGDDEIAAAVGTVCLQAGEFRSALDGGLTLDAVLAKAAAGNALPAAVRALVFLSGRNRTVRDYAEKALAGIARDGRAAGWNELLAGLRRFADDRDAAPADALETAAGRFETFVRTFSKAPVSGKLPGIAAEYADLLSQITAAGWDEGEEIPADSLRMQFLELLKYDAAKGFANKSEILTGFLRDLHNAVETIGQQPTILSDACYRRKFEALEEQVTQAYRKLCQTTKPIVKIGDKGRVAQSPGENGELVLEIPVISADNYVQNAANVCLHLRPDESGSCSFAETIPLSGEIPSDGRTVIVRVPVNLKRPAEIITVRAQLTYDYISDIDIKYGKKRRITRTEKVSGTAVFPDLAQWKSLDIAVEQITRHPLTLDRVDQFAENGNVRLTDPGIRQILKNRDETIREAIDCLTCPDPSAPERRIPNPMGRWVIEHGQWRSGKTVVMKIIEDRLKDRASFPHVYVLYLDLSKVKPQRKDAGDGALSEATGSFDDAIAYHIYFGLRKLIGRENEEDFRLFEELREEYDLPEKMHADRKLTYVPWEIMTLFLRDFVQDLQERDPEAGIALLVDEFTEVYPAIRSGRVDADFLKRWVAMLAEARVLCVTAGGEHMKTMLQTYAPNAQQKANKYLLIDYLSREDTELFVRYVLGESAQDAVPERNAYLTPAFAEETINRIYRLTRGNAYMLKRLCSWLINYIRMTDQGILKATTVLAAVDDFLERSGREGDQIETDLFHSLFDPFRELSEEAADRYADDAPRIEDDEVREDNLLILHTIVALANPESHLCTYEELRSACGDRMGGTDRFEKRFRTLKDRRIVVLDANDNVSVYVDLYYEVISRVGRKESV
ncbi:MAG: hypothetical protein K6G16_09585 [Lachnospiraceae bacterium]|nr:hypothetical protein [Lachnospiraceae bacterium]